MRKKLTFSLFSLVFLLGLFSLTSAAADSTSNWKGSFLFGYRFVGTSGAEFKYKEDINLEKGARLFNFSLSYIPSENGTKILDRLNLSLQNFGGDPFETFTLEAAKVGRFAFRYDRKKAAYFYHDLHEAGGTTYDPHTFDLERRSDSGQLSLTLSRQLDLVLAYERFSRKGKGTPTLDINRVEFEFDQPYDEESKLGTITLNFHTRPFSLVLDEKIHDFRTTNSFFLPGYADGGPASLYPTSLNYFSLNQPYDFRSYTHSLKFNLRPFSSLLLSGSARLINLDMDLDYEEKGQGVDYLGWLFAYDYKGKGDYSRDLKLYDVNASYLLFSRLALVATVRYQTFDQEGTLTIDQEKETVKFGFNTLGVEAGVQAMFSSRLHLTLGYRQEKRELEELETATYETKTTQQGFFGHLRFEPSPTFRLSLDYQRADIDDPFTLISPTATNRFKVDSRLRLNKLQVSGSYLIYRQQSEVFEDSWKSDRTQANLRIGYQLGKATLSAGTTMINVKSQADRTVAYRPFWTGPAGTFPWLIRYEGKSSLYDLSVGLAPAPNLRLEGMIGKYTNRGFWPIDRLIAKLGAEYSLPNGLLLKATYKYWDFKEKNSGFNDYKASIFELSFGVRWD